MGCEVKKFHAPRRQYRHFMLATAGITVKIFAVMRRTQAEAENMHGIFTIDYKLNDKNDKIYVKNKKLKRTPEVLLGLT